MFWPRLKLPTLLVLAQEMRITVGLRHQGTWLGTEVSGANAVGSVCETHASQKHGKQQKTMLIVEIRKT